MLASPGYDLARRVVKAKPEDQIGDVVERIDELVKFLKRRMEDCRAMTWVFR